LLRPLCKIGKGDGVVGERG